MSETKVLFAGGDSAGTRRVSGASVRLAYVALAAAGIEIIVDDLALEEKSSNHSIKRLCESESTPFLAEQSGKQKAQWKRETYGLPRG